MGWDEMSCMPLASTLQETGQTLKRGSQHDVQWRKRQEKTQRMIDERQQRQAMTLQHLNVQPGRAEKSDIKWLTYWVAVMNKKLARLGAPVIKKGLTWPWRCGRERLVRGTRRENKHGVLCVWFELSLNGLERNLFSDTFSGILVVFKFWFNSHTSMISTIYLTKNPTVSTDRCPEDVNLTLLGSPAQRSQIWHPSMSWDHCTQMGVYISNSMRIVGFIRNFLTLLFSDPARLTRFILPVNAAK